MIEFLLIFGFGFLVAILLAMLVTPAVYNRIVKLTESRIKATVPLSSAEVRGKLDMARAAYASDNARLSAELARERDITTEARLETQRYQSDLAGVAGRLREAEQRIETLINESDRLHSEGRKKDQHAESLAHRITELNLHRDAANREMSQMYNDLVSATTELENLRIDFATSETELLNLNTQLDSERNERRKIEQELAAARAATSETESRLNAEQDQHNEARINLSAALSSIYNMEEDLKQAEARIADIGKERDTAVADSRAARDRVESLESEVADWKSKWETAREQLEHTGSRLDELGRKMSHLESERDRLLSETEPAGNSTGEPVDDGQKDVAGPAVAELVAIPATGEAPDVATQHETGLIEVGSEGDQILPPTDVSTEDREEQRRRDGEIATLLEKLQTSVRRLTRETGSNSKQVNEPVEKTEVANINAKPEPTDIAEIQKRQNELVEELRQAVDEDDRDRLRDEIADLAARVVGFVARREGDTSALRDMLRSASASREAGDPGTEKPRSSLADRIVGELEEQA